MAREQEGKAEEILGEDEKVAPELITEAYEAVNEKSIAQNECYIEHESENVNANENENDSENEKKGEAGYDTGSPKQRCCGQKGEVVPDQ